MKTRILLSLALLFSVAVVAADADISGDWIIDSSVGGATPIKVRCTLIQAADKLSGTCTPEMENAEASKLTGTVNGSKAEWSYDVVFRDQPGHIAFTADSVSSDKISGKLSLSGTEAPFTASRGN